MTNPTPDTTLAARLIELSVKSTQDPLNEDGRYFNGDWHSDLTQCSHGDTGNYSNRRDGQFIATLWNAFRDGQIITLAEHEAIIAAIDTTPDPRDNVIKGLAEALRNIAVVGFSSDPSVNGAIAKQTVLQARTVLAEIEKGGV